MFASSRVLLVQQKKKPLSSFSFQRLSVTSRLQLSPFSPCSCKAARPNISINAFKPKKDERVGARPRFGGGGDERGLHLRYAFNEATKTKRIKILQKPPPPAPPAPSRVLRHVRRGSQTRQERTRCENQVVSPSRD